MSKHITEFTLQDAKAVKGVENHLNNLVIALGHAELNINRYLEIERI